MKASATCKADRSEARAAEDDLHEKGRPTTRVEVVMLGTAQDAGQLPKVYAEPC